jgi:hypothetical protein
MIRALMTISFMGVLLWWLQWEFRKKVSLKEYWYWLVAALVVQAIAGIIFAVIDDRIKGNLLYHGIGGGVTTTLLFVYVMKTYRQKLNWRTEAVILYCFVSALGTLNELAEYAAELLTRDGAFSWDSHDTWRDLTANTVGALLAWLMYRFSMAYLNSRKKRT